MVTVTRTFFRFRYLVRLRSGMRIRGRLGWLWKKHTVLDGVGSESPTFTDLTGDGKPELVCIHDERWGYASPHWKRDELTVEVYADQ